MKRQKPNTKFLVSQPTPTLADYITAAMTVINITGHQVTIAFDAVAVATVLASLGWTAKDVDAFTAQHPELPTTLIDMTFEALSDIETTRGPPNDSDP